MKSNEFDDLFADQAPDFSGKDWKRLETGLELFDVKKRLRSVFWVIPGMSAFFALTVLGFSYQLYKTNARVVELEKQLGVVQKQSQLVIPKMNDKELTEAVPIESQRAIKRSDQQASIEIQALNEVQTKTLQTQLYDNKITLEKTQVTDNQITVKNDKNLIDVKENFENTLTEATQKEISLVAEKSIQPENKSVKVKNNSVSTPKSLNSIKEFEAKNAAEKINSIANTQSNETFGADSKKNLATNNGIEKTIEVPKVDVPIPPLEVIETKVLAEAKQPETKEEVKVIPQRTTLEEIARIKKIDKKNDKLTKFYSLGFYGGIVSPFGRDIIAPDGSTFGAKIIVGLKQITKNSRIDILLDANKNNLSFKLDNREPRRFGVPMGNPSGGNGSSQDPILVKTSVRGFSTMQFGIGLRYNYLLNPKINLYAGTNWSFTKQNKFDIDYEFFNPKTNKTEDQKRLSNDSEPNASNLFTPNFGINYLFSKHLMFESEAFYSSQFKDFKENPNTIGLKFGLNYKF